MSSNLMDTEKGGEQTQYEGEHTDMLPHKQEAGQLGGMSFPSFTTPTFPSAFLTTTPVLQTTSTLTLFPASAIQGASTSQPTSTETSKTNEPNTVGITPADKIRYGQSLQEGGMGGKTGSEGGLVGGEADKKTEDMSAAGERRAQGYGGAKDMDREVGA